MNILVTGCNGPASINFIRSLRDASDPYYVVGTDSNTLRQSLSLADKTCHVPPCSDDRWYINTLNDIIDAEHVGFVHAQPDSEVRIIGEHRDMLHADTFLPKQDTIQTCQDKYLSYACWKHADMRVAATALADQLYLVHEMLERWEKPLWPLWVRARHGAGGNASTIVHNSVVMQHWINYWLKRDGANNMSCDDSPFIVQEYLPGRNIAWHSIWNRGKLITSMARERLEYIYPGLTPSGVTGTPSVQRTIHDSVVNHVAKEAVLAIDPAYTGVACVDLKEDCMGFPVPTEINAGRFFTTSYFFTCAGYNMPHLYLQVAQGEDVEAKMYNALPDGLMWVRHMDAPARLLDEEGMVIGGWHA